VSDDSTSARAYRPADTSTSLFTSLNARFILLATLSAATVVAFAIVAGAGLSSLSKSNQAMQQIAQVIQRHMDGDMMHDAINSDVMKGRIAAVEKNATDLAAAVESFNEDSATFRKDVADNLKEDLPAGIQAKLRGVEKGLGSYVEAGQAVLTSLTKGEASQSAIATFGEKLNFSKRRRNPSARTFWPGPKTSNWRASALLRRRAAGS
jgi:hypothetical protein